MSDIHHAVADLFGAVFGSIYPDALLHRMTRAEDSGGTVTESWAGLGGLTGAETIKAQKDRCTYSMRQAEGYAEGDCAFIVLTHSGEAGLPDLHRGDRMTWPAQGGDLYSVESDLVLDAAASHWMIRARPVR